jgi:hypothetical protein
MTLRLAHILVPARDQHADARFLADLLDLEVTGESSGSPDAHFAVVRVAVRLTALRAEQLDAPALLHLPLDWPSEPLAQDELLDLPGGGPGEARSTPLRALANQRDSGPSLSPPIASNRTRREFCHQGLLCAWIAGRDSSRLLLVAAGAVGSLIRAVADRPDDG